MAEHFSNESKVGIGLGLLGVVGGLLPTVVTMSPSFLWGLRALCGLLVMAAVLIFADVAGYRRAGIAGLLIFVMMSVVAGVSYRLGQHSREPVVYGTQSDKQLQWFPVV